MSADDAGWAAELMERRRQQYASYSPVFWRPAVGVMDLHRQFLARVIAHERVMALRSRHAFVICQRRRAQGEHGAGDERGPEGMVDDFAVEPPGTWADDGAALLRALAERLTAAGDASVMRVVTANADRPKADMLESLSLTLAEQWWVRELTSAAATTPAARAPGERGGRAQPERVDGDGFSGVLVPAPGVYAPGGPVFQTDRVDPGADLAVVERDAARRGAVLAVVPAPPDTALAADLRRNGWSVASDWYLGWPGGGSAK